MSRQEVIASTATSLRAQLMLTDESVIRERLPAILIAQCRLMERLAERVKELEQQVAANSNARR